MIWFIRRPSIWAIAAGAVALAGCSLHPLPDDVSTYSTEEIVRNVRCEAKEAVRQRIQEALFEAGIAGINPEEVLKDRNLARIRRINSVLAAKFVCVWRKHDRLRIQSFISSNTITMTDR